MDERFSLKDPDIFIKINHLTSEGCLFKKHCRNFNKHLNDCMLSCNHSFHIKN